MCIVLHVLLYWYVEVYPDLTDVRHAGQYFGTLTELVNGDSPVFNKRSEGGDSVRQPTGCSETCESETIIVTPAGASICKRPLIRCSSSDAGSSLGNLFGSLITMCGCRFLMTRLVAHSCTHTLSYT
jgi:hypothetical protein